MTKLKHLNGGSKSFDAPADRHPLVKRLKQRGAGLLLVHPLLLTSNKKLFDSRNEPAYRAYKYDVYGVVRGLDERDVFYLAHDSRELGAISAVFNYHESSNMHLFSKDGAFNLVFRDEISRFTWIENGKHSDGQVGALYSFLDAHDEIRVAGIENAYNYAGNAVKKAREGTALLYSQLSLCRSAEPIPEITLRLKYPEQEVAILKTHALLSPVGTALPESERGLIRETWEATRISAIAERLNMGVIFAYPLLVQQSADAGKYNFYRNTLLMLSAALEGRSFLISAKPALKETQEHLNPMPMLSTGERRLKISGLERQVQDGAVYGKLTLFDRGASEGETLALLEFFNRFDAIMVIGTRSRAEQVAQELERTLGRAVPRPIIVNANFCMDDA